MQFGQIQFGLAFRIMLKTAPIMLLRLGLYLAFWVASIVYFALVAGIGYVLSQVWPPAGIIAVIVAIVALIPLYRLANRYAFYLVKAAQLAVVVHILETGDLPQGINQFAFGKDRIAERFGEVSVMFVVDALIAGVIRGFSGMVTAALSWIPGGIGRTIAGISTRIVHYAGNYVDEAVLARAFWRKDESVWQSAREGLVLYGMVWKPLLMNAIALMLLSYVPFILVVVLLSAPAGLLLGAISQPLGALSIVIVVVLALLVKVALGDSFAMIAMVAAYHRSTRGLAPDPAMEARIESISDKFGEIRDRALAARRPSSPLPVASDPYVSE
ncbi:MAG: hypothetical protein QM346_17740 [Chloroflexota bacterium]|nr:hypothetical protein [Chloroflexota bacterium]